VEPLHEINPQRFLFAYENHTIIVEAGIKNDLATAAAIAEKKQQEAKAAEEVVQEIEAAHDNLDFILDIPMEMTVELGRTKQRINEVLKIGQGSVVELNQLDGEPVDILVNNTLIARGEVVVEREKYGIRISEIISRKDRIRSLK
jgi:flagellar motor switch protein FliN/FliY